MKPTLEEVAREVAPLLRDLYLKYLDAAAQRSRVQGSGSPTTPVVGASSGDLSGEAA